MTSILVDSNIFIDIFWGGANRSWSASMLRWLGSGGDLIINPIIWSEIGAGFDSEGRLHQALDGLAFDRRALPFEAAFVAGQTHQAYRHAGGQRDRTLPDFLVGAHAQVEGMAILTRDARRYRSYFPDVEVYGLDSHPSGAPT